jgi:hypothetical protein
MGSCSAIPVVDILSFVGKPHGKNRSDDERIDLRIILKWVLRK